MKKVLKYLSTGLLSLSIIFSVAPIKNVNALAQTTPIVKLDGNVISFPTDGQPYINENDRTMVSVRFISESMQCKVEWNDPNQLITITKGDKKIFLVIGQEWATVFNTTANTSTRKVFDTKAVLKSDRTFVPLRFVSEALGAGVAWDEKNNSVIVRSDGTVEPVSTPIQKPTPTPKSWKNAEVPMNIVGSDEMPDGFIKPQFIIKHHVDGSAGYFDIELKNIDEYRSIASDYSYKITCLNYDLVNWTVGIPDIKRVDNIRYLENSFKHKYVNPYLWSSPSTDLKFSNHPELGEVAIHPGVNLEMQVEFYYAGLKQIYKDSIELKPEVEE